MAHTHLEAPQHPVGPMPAPVAGPVVLADLAGPIAALTDSSVRLREAVRGLSQAQLDTKYRNWTVRQIVHHLPDSHANLYIRFKWALTEDEPLIKAYDETAWSDLAVSKTGDIGVPLALMDAVHASWTALVRTMSAGQFERGFMHPQTGKRVRLADAVRSYAWHADHHIGQILWMRKAYGWG